MSYPRKHPRVAKRKIRDTVIETKTQYVGRKSENKRQAMIILM